MACLCLAMKMFVHRQVHTNHLLALHFMPLFFHSCVHVAVACQLLAVQFLTNSAACVQRLNSELINHDAVTRLLVPKQVAFVIWSITVFALIFKVVNSFP